MNSKDLLIESGTITFSFKMKKPVSINDVADMIMRLGVGNTDIIDTTAEPCEELNPAPKQIKKPKRVNHKREYPILGETMSMYNLGDELYPGDELTRQQKYRKVSGVLERNFKLPNGQYDNKGFVKYMTKEISKARTIKKAAESNVRGKMF